MNPAGQLTWNIHCTQDVSDGRVFADMIPMMQRSLQQVFPTVQISRANTFPIVRKGEMVGIPSDSNLVTLGLGWDVCEFHVIFSFGHDVCCDKER